MKSGILCSGHPINFAFRKKQMCLPLVFVAILKDLIIFLLVSPSVIFSAITIAATHDYWMFHS